MNPYDQAPFDRRFEWGLAGLQRLAPGSDVIIIVDVLSFSTAVDVSVGRGARIYPSEGRAAAAKLAARLGASLAVARSDMDEFNRFSLSPNSLKGLERGQELVLPSLNGARLTLAAARFGVRVLTGCLRNARAVARLARWCGPVITVIAAGEQWLGDDQGLRPAFEDLIGAGAILNALGGHQPSPEARSATAVYQGLSEELEHSLVACASGRELQQDGFAQDVHMAAALDISSSVPALIGGAFEDAS